VQCVVRFPARCVDISGFVNRLAKRASPIRLHLERRCRKPITSRRAGGCCAGARFCRRCSRQTTQEVCPPTRVHYFKPVNLGTAPITVHKDSSQYCASLRKAAVTGRIRPCIAVAKHRPPRLSDLVWHCVATRWRHGLKEESRPEGRLSENLIKSEACLVAGTGFEPVTFRL
jgi:hypothetical protein